MNDLETEGIVHAHTEIEPDSTVDFAQFALEQFRAPLQEGGPKRSGVELLTTLEGEVAAKLGKEVFEHHMHQRYPSWYSDIDPLPLEPKIVRAAVLSVKGKEKKSFPRKYTRDNRYTYTVPVTVKDIQYVLEDSEGKIYVFTDHTNSVVPSHAMYREMSRRKKMDIPSTLFDIFQSFGHTSERRNGKDRIEFIRYLEDHARVANAHGITINVNKFTEYFDKGYFAQHSPMHCYLSGVEGTNKDGRLTKDGQFILRGAIRRNRHQYPGPITEERLASDLMAQCETVQGVFNILRYDVLPVNQDAKSLKTDLAFYLVRDYLYNDIRTEEDDKRSLVRLSASQLASFLVQLSSQLSDAGDGQYMLMSKDNTEFHQRQLIGLLGNADVFGFESYTQIYELMEHVPMKKSEKKRFLRDLRIAVEAIELKEISQTELQSYEVSSWLGIGEQKDLIGETHTPNRFFDYKIAQQSGNLLGRSRLQWQPRLQLSSDADRWTIPMISGLQAGDVEKKHPLWSAWMSYGLELQEHARVPLQILPAITKLRQFLHSPFWNLQTETRQTEITDHFLHWLKTTIHDHVTVNHIPRSSMDFTMRKKLNHEIQRLIERSSYSREGQHYGQYGKAISEIITSVSFAIQMEQLYKDLHALEYYAVPPTVPGTSFHIGSDYIPYHLAAMQAKEFQRVKYRIEYGLREVRGGEEHHLGVRVRMLAAHPDKEIKCWGYIIPIHKEKSELTSWIFRDQSREIILNWVRESGFVLTDDQWNTAENIMVGTAFFTWIRQEIGLEWSAYKEKHDHAEKVFHLKRAITLAGALQDINKADNANYHSGALDQASYLEIYLTEALELHTENRIVPFGELTLQPRRPKILRAENMAGKSSIMRGILYAALLQNQGLPHLGRIEIPFGLGVDTPIGTESQGVDKSLITSAITGLHRIAGIGVDELLNELNIWAIDEMGRRTNKHFGETLFMTSLILSSLVRNGSNIVVSASHYHDLDRFTPLLEALGITPQWLTVDSNHALREVRPDERTKSLAIASLLPFVGSEALELWPDEGDRRELGIPYNPEMYKKGPSVSRGRIEEISYADIFGVSREQRHQAVSTILGEVDDRITGSFEEVFLKNIDGGQQAQKLFESLRHHDVRSEIHTLKVVLALADFYNPRQGTVEYENFEKRERSTFTNLGLVNDVDHKLSQKSWRRKANAALRRLNSDYRKAVKAYNKSMKESGFSGFSSTGMLRSIDFSTLHNPGHTLQDQMAFVVGSLSYVKRMSAKTNKYGKVRYTKKAVVDMKNAFNPFIHAGHIVPNDVYIDFSDGAAGTFISGENYSGKSNYLRTIGIALWLARTTGFAPASNIRMNKKVLPLSLTQPVSDEIGASSMMVESRDRLQPAYLVSQGVRGSLIVSLVDEPAAPTSPEDATKTNVWLYRNYQLSRGRSKLIVSSHSNDVPALLAQEKIPVELAAFRLLSTTEKFKKIPGTVDSNALEVAKELGLHPLIYDFSVLVHEYIKAVDAGPVSDEAVKDYAERLMGLLHAIESIPPDPKWAH